jgi:acyl carrier protein
MENLSKEVKEIVANVIGLETNEFENSTHLYNELGADSVIGFDISAKIQKKYKIAIDPNDVVNLVSVETIAQYINEKKQ